nr:translation initiation factor IF-3 [Thermaerobacter subterraneus]
MVRDLRVNEQIRVREVRVISPEGEQLGIFPTHEALRMAYERNMDLVEVAPQARPPVCRIMDYGKFKYEQAKRDREARKRQKIVDIKEVKMRPRIDQHDFEVKLRNARRFLEDGDKVKATIMFRGREIVHADLGRQVLERLARAVEDIATIERRPVVEGRNMTMVLAPRPQVVGASRAEARPAAGEGEGAAGPAGEESRAT